MLRLRHAAALRPFRSRDFCLLWAGAFLSFNGSWIQQVAQQWLVFELTGDESKLALVGFMGMAPAALLGPIAGTLADTMDKRLVLILTQLAFALGALFLGLAALPVPGHAHGWVTYGHVLSIALMLGIVGSLETPVRQTVISRVVPAEDLGAAIPLNAMTFNGARLIGPAIGGILLASWGAHACYLVNAVSYLALIIAVFFIKANLGAAPRRPEPILDLIQEGIRYTLRDDRLRTLFILESITAAFGLVYIQLLSAFAKENLGLTKQGLGTAMSCIGVGAILGLILTAAMSRSGRKRELLLIAMTTMGIGLLLLGLFPIKYIALPLMAVVGGSAIIQFNTTNSLFQMLSPENLRGRVIAMHIWALSGLGPFGTLLLGWMAKESRHWMPGSGVVGVPFAYVVGGFVIFLGAVWGYSQRGKLVALQ